MTCRPGSTSSDVVARPRQRHLERNVSKSEPSADAPLPYIERIRSYYLALGYERPYQWASFDEVPFCRPTKPMHDWRVGVITTAAPFQPGKGEQGPHAPYNGKAKFFTVYSGATATEPDLRISHIAIDRAHTSAEDQGTYFPLQALKRLENDGVIRCVGPRFHGLPTNRSQKTTMEVDCPEVVRRCLDDDVDVAVLVPNCPVCHQSVSLAARALERAGIPSVIMGCAKDIVEHVGVPRLLFNDFPLGNSAGRPGDFESQLEIARLALQLLADADGPRTTIQSPLAWTRADDWKRDYSNADLLSAEDIAARRIEFDKAKADAKKA